MQLISSAQTLEYIPPTDDIYISIIPPVLEAILTVVMIVAFLIGLVFIFISLVNLIIYWIKKENSNKVRFRKLLKRGLIIAGVVIVFWLILSFVFNFFEILNMPPLVPIP